MLTEKRGKPSEASRHFFFIVAAKRFAVRSKQTFYQQKLVIAIFVAEKLNQKLGASAANVIKGQRLIVFIIRLTDMRLLIYYTKEKNHTQLYI